ncbi:MFS transporter [Nonomuraea sp. NPDC049504]|uniref:MFS transporter n=1 Tax=Nonomuraea sp. NPDC049504 TaxID=3154729 RepID=UPI003417EBB7
MSIWTRPRELLGGLFSGPLGRLLAIALLTNTGRGVWLASFVLFYTRSIGLSPAQVGVGALVAGVVGIGSTTPVGMVADRFGLSRSLLVLYLISAVAFLLYLGVTGFWSFIVVGCVAAVAGESSVGVRTALITALAPGGERIAALAKYRVVSQVGMAAGAGAGALVIQVDSRPVYTAMLVGTALAYLLAALLVGRLPRAEGGRGRRGRRGSGRVLRDHRYLTLAGLFGVLTVNWSMLSVGIPLWVAEHTDAPRWTSGAILVANTAAIALLQVRFSRSAETVPGAGRASVRSGLLFALACAVFATTAGTSGVLTMVLLFVAGAIHIIGELLYVAGSWGVSVGLMPEDAQGEYQGAMAAGTASAQALGPLLMTTFVVGWGSPGWLVLAGLFALAGWAAFGVARSAWRRVAPEAAAPGEDPARAS